MVKKIASRVYMGLIFLFLYLPIVVLIVLSFNNSKSKVKWGGFTLDWYIKCFQSVGDISASFRMHIVGKARLVYRCLNNEL